MTQDQFIKSEIAVWGEDYIFDLIERGYSPMLTDNGWYWLLPALDTASEMCYNDGAALLPLRS